MADKALEAWYVELLRDIWPAFPPGPRTPSENPDCLVHSPTGVVGIEVTTVMLEPERGEQPIREAQSLRNRIVARARDIYREADAPVLIVDIEFDDHVRLTKRDVEGVSNEIAQLLLAHPFHEESPLGWYQQVRARMPKGVVGISGGRYRRAESWDGGSGARMRECTPVTVQSIIDKKAARYAAYRSQCDAVILAIVFSAVHDPRMQVEASVLEHVYTSPFDATIALLADEPLAIELKVQQPVV